VRRLLFLLLLPTFLLAACGGGGDKEDAQSLLDQAFSSSIESANLKLDAQLELKGSKQLKDPVRIQASGPFRSNPGKLPSVDLSLELGTSGAGQVIQTGFLSTGDRAFVKFQDVYYEQPVADVQRTNRELGRRKGRKGSSLSALGLDPRSWLGEAKDEGEETVAGVRTHHVSGTLEVTEVLHDLNDFVRRGGSALTGATGQKPAQQLSRADIAKIAQVVENPTFDVYVGIDDDIIRRISGRIEIDVPDGERSSVGGLEGGTFDFSLEFSDVDGKQKIEAPGRARPLSELTRSLGGAGTLSDALGAAGGSDDDDSGETTTPDSSTLTETTPTVPAQPTPNVPNGSGDASTTPNAADFQRYADCLDKAHPEDTDALQRCTELLQQ
jgi:hypothetical protein